MTEPIIQLKGVSKTFGEQLILDQIDLDIYPHQGLGIIGPSGTGKSTILRIIAGLLPPDTGEIWVAGKKRLGLIEDSADPIGIGMVFQQSALFDSLTVGENVGFLLYERSKMSRKQIRDLVAEKLEMVGLSNTIDMYPSQLSGGMRKRVSFARAIIANPENAQDNPEVLLYDEPTAGLDPIASTVIENLVRKLQSTSGGCSSYVMVTHQESTIKRTADQVIFLYQGKVQWQGNIMELETTYHPMIKQFLTANINGPIQVAG
jgi:phospholipid/cholesterol/gamma-HCH transport system ATP-binding protein